MPKTSWLFLILSPWLLFTSASSSAPLVLESAEKIWDRAPHNAFTDLVRFRERFLCAFREGEGHVASEGRIRILASRDGRRWTSIALVAKPGVDLRDPKLSVAPGNRLLLLMGGTIWDGRKQVQFQTRVAFSADGVQWSPVESVLSPGEWLWRAAWYRGRAYGVSYGSGFPKGVLYSSADGRAWEKVTDLNVPGLSEVTLRFLKDGRMVALIRSDAGTRRGSIGVSAPPYRDWTFTEIPHRLGGPEFLVLPDGRMIAASRDHRDGPAVTAAGWMTTTSYEPEVKLPSGGDCSYPGMVWHKGRLWISYYASHEGKSAVYMAVLRLR